MPKNSTQAIILAAGRSSRFNTEKSKLLYSVCGQAMIMYPIKAIAKTKIPITAVLGYRAEEVRSEIEKANLDAQINFVKQEEQLGTGHAVKISREKWEKDNILILNGDAPFLTYELIK